jgi:hypothetical protein
MATAYTPAADLTGIAVYSDISASEASGTGYTGGWVMALLFRPRP